MDYQKIPLICDPLLKGYSIDTNGIIYGKMETHFTLHVLGMDI